MATRFYTDPTNTPAVSPDFYFSWDDTTQAVRRKLVIDTHGNNDSIDFNVNETATFSDEICVAQFVSEPLDAISSAFEVFKTYFRCLESNAKANAFLLLYVLKCDSDGNNTYLIGGPAVGTEFDGGVLTNRGSSTGDLGDDSLSQGDRLIVEVGAYFVYSKDSGYNATISVTDNHATDLPENNTETAAYNSWIETGDTFTVASGDPDPPWEVVKLGPMFAFA